jgi:hypothetical protein
MPRVLGIGIQTAIARHGVSVIAIPGDIALRHAVTDFRKAGFLHFDGLDYLAGARQDLLEKFAKEFLSRIGGDNFVDGFLHGSRIPLG